MSEHVITRHLGMLAPEWKSMAMPDMAPLWWKASAKTKRSTIEVNLCLNEDCLTVQAPLPLDPDLRCQASLWRYLLRLNNEMRLVKFSVDAADKVFLSAEIPLHAGSAPAFADLKAVLTALSVYFDEFHREIELVSRDQSLAHAWLALQPTVEDVTISVVRETAN